MKLQHFLAPATALAVVLGASAAFAQTTPASTTINGVTYVTTPVTVPVAANTNNATLSSIAVTGTGTLTSIPLVFSTSDLTQLSGLSRCTLTGPNGAVNSTPFIPQPNVNTVMLLNPVALSGAAANFSLACNVGTVATGTVITVTPNVPNTGSNPGVPNTGSGTVTTGPGVTLDTAPSVPAGSSNVALANVIFNGPANVSALPLTIAAGNGASVGDLSGCHIGTSIAGTALSNQVAVNTTGATGFTLAVPFTQTLGTNSLALRCNVSAATPVGSTFTISIDPASVGLTAGGPTSGTIVVTGVGTAPSNPGVPNTGSGAGSATPGIPNTGAGGLAASFLFVLLFAAVAAALGIAYIRYERTILE